MTDDPTRPDPSLDEVASALLDGLGTPEEEARAAADPELRARVARLRAAREAIRTVDRPVDPERRDLAIAAALDLAEAPAPVHQLADARRRRTTRQLGWVAAIAAVLALAVVLPRVLDDDRDANTALTASPKAAEDRTDGGAPDSDAGLDRESSAPFSSSGSGSASEASPELPAPVDGDAGAAAPTTTADASTCCPLTDLGPASDLEGLVEPARRAVDPARSGLAQQTAPAPPSSHDVACLHQLESIATTPAEPDGPAPSVILRAVASVDDEPVLAVVVERDDGSRELVAARTAGCELLGTVGL